jgi:hypothetical protein
MKRLQSLETTLQEHVEFTKKEQEEAKKRTEGLQKEPEDEEDDGLERKAAITEIEEQSRLLKAELESSQVISSQVRSRLLAQGIGNTGNTGTFGDYNSGFQAVNISGGVSGLNFGGK